VIGVVGEVGAVIRLVVVSLVDAEVRCVVRKIE
jgi:hypothetical protein